jgi:hypothetical protein
MRIILLLIAVLSLSSCEDCLWFLHDSDTPDCIEEEIASFKAEMNDICDSGASVIKYEFQEEIVYAFDQGICISDGTIEVLNEECELICTLGTIAGIIECREESFENAIELKVLWEQ